MRNVYINVFSDAYNDWSFSNRYLLSINTHARNHNHHHFFVCKEEYFVSFASKDLKYVLNDFLFTYLWLKLNLFSDRVTRYIEINRVYLVLFITQIWCKIIRVILVKECRFQISIFPWTIVYYNSLKHSKHKTFHNIK